MSEGDGFADEAVQGSSIVGEEGSPPSLPPMSHVQRCLRRFAGVRSAQRALAPSVAELREESAQEEGQQLRKRLESLAEQWKALDILDRPDPAKIEAVRDGFTAVDEQLSEISDALRAHADAVHAVQFRSTLPEIARRHRKEVCALLDLLIEDAPGLERRRATIEYLVTLLSTDDESGTRKISHDPARLTPAMEALCEGLQDRFSGVCQEYELDFFEAANIDESTDVFARVREIREKKEEIGSACFVSGVLRAIVTYNARMANQMSHSVVNSREDDLAFEDLVGDNGLLSAEPEPEVEESLDFATPDLVATPAVQISIHESNGIDQIREAIRRRLRSVPIGSCASERAALAVDMSALNEEELDMLRSTDDGEDARLTASVLLVGLLNAVLPIIEPQLAEIEITRKHLHEDWPQELDQDLQTRIRTLLASNGYEAACMLSEFKTKHLYASLSSLARDRRDRDGVGPKREKRDTAKAQMLKFARAAQAELGGFRKGDWVGPVSMIVYGKGTGRQIRSAVVSIVSICLFVFVGINLISAEETEVVELRPRELSDISRYLKTAYRNEQGSGMLVVGEVDAGWYDLSGEERVEAAREMRQQFLDENIMDAMIYDERHQLQIYLASGELRRPKPPEDDD